MSLADARVETRLPAQDLERARRWYADKFGLMPSEARRRSALRVRGRGVLSVRSTGSSEGTFTQMAFTVDDIEATVAELRSRGVVFEEFGIPGLPMVTALSSTYRTTIRARAEASAAHGSVTAKVICSASVMPAREASHGSQYRTALCSSGGYTADGSPSTVAPANCSIARSRAVHRPGSSGRRRDLVQRGAAARE